MNKTKIEFGIKTLFLLGCAILLAGTVAFLWSDKTVFSFNEAINSGKFGQIGDFIGGIVGTLWALAGVLLFYLALKEQRIDIKINQDTLRTQVKALNQQIEEFKLQTKELEQTREVLNLQAKELEQTRVVFKEQGQTLKIQRFENTFFQLLQLNQQILNNLHLESKGVIPFSDQNSYTEREVLTESKKVLFDRLDKALLEVVRDGKKTSFVQIDVKNKDIAYEKLIKGYREFYFEDTNQIFSHYYRNTYHIFKFIFKSELIGKDKKQFYASLARAQLSSDELVLIFYNSLIDNLGKPNFLFLIKEFDVLQNFDFNIISQFKFHKEIFESEKENLQVTI